MNKRFIMSLALGVMAVTIIGGSALAFGGRTDGESRLSNFSERVGQILGLDGDDVHDAMTEARQDMHEEAFVDKIDALVSAETLTTDEAQEITDWYSAKPADIPVWLTQMHKMGRGMFNIGADGDIENKLDNLVETERITEEEAVAYLDWYEARPEVLTSDLLTLDSGFGGFRGHGGGKFFRGGGGHGFNHSIPSPETTTPALSDAPVLSTHRQTGWHMVP